MTNLMSYTGPDILDTVLDNDPQSKKKKEKYRVESLIEKGQISGGGNYVENIFNDF